MTDRLSGSNPALADRLSALGLEELRTLAQNVIDDCHARLSPEARDILSDEGVKPDHTGGSHSSDILDAAYLDAMQDGDKGAALDLLAAARLASAHRYAAEAATKADLNEAIYEALMAADVEPGGIPALAQLLG